LFNLSHVDRIVHLRLDQVVFLLLLLKFLVVIKTLQLVLLIQLLDILFILLLRQSFLTQFVQNCLLSFLFFLFEVVFVALLSEDVGTEYVFVLFIILDLEGLKLILVSFSQLFNFQLITTNLNLRVRNLRLHICILSALVLIKVDTFLVFLDFVVRIQLVLLRRQHLSLSELARDIVLDASGEDLHISDLDCFDPDAP